MRYRLFRRRSNNQFYFQFLTDDDTQILNSEGYSDKSARDNGLESVLANAGDGTNYESLSADGNYSFILKATNGQEIGRSVDYASEAERDAALSLFQQQAPGIRTATETVETTAEGEKPYEADGKEDNYKPLAFYEERITGVEAGFDSFTEANEHYFTYNLNGNVYLISEGYGSTNARDNGINSVTNNMSDETRYQRMQHPNGMHYFNLRAGNNREIATSRWFDSLDNMNDVISRMILGIGLSGIRLGDGVELEAANRTANIVMGAAPVPLETAPKKKRKKRKTEKKPKAEKVYLADGNYLFNDVSWQIFRSGNNKHYFTFKNKEGKTLFLNADVRGFETQEEAQAVVDQISQYAPYEANYEGKMARNGKYYFYLLGEDNQKIGKSFFYNTEEEMQAAVGLLLGSELQNSSGLDGDGGQGGEDAASSTESSGASETATSSEKEIDDYLPCGDYGGEGGFHRFYVEERKEYYFSYNHENTTTYLRSEGYTTEKARENGISSVIKNAPLEERWKTGTALNGKYHYFALVAGNHQEIARSCYYEDEGAMMADWAWVKGEESPIGAGSQEIDGVRLSAAAILAKEAADAKPEKEIDDYLPCGDYGGEGGFHSFYVEERKEYYFSYNHENTTTFLRSEGYTTAKARDNGINSVIKNAPLEERWKTGTALNGKYHYFALFAGNHQEIARSCYYEDEGAMMADWAWIKGEESPIGAGSKEIDGVRLSAAAILAQEAANAKPDREIDDYLPCNDYAGAEGFHRFYVEDRNEHYFSYNDENGATILRSEGYTTEKARENGINSVIKNAPLEERWKTGTALNGKYHYFALVAGNHQEIARSCYFEDEAAMLIPFAWIRGGESPIGAGSQEIDGVRLSAAAILAKEAADAKPEKVVDDYLPCNDYAGAEGFHRFYVEDRNEYYFAYNNADGETILRSEGYTTEKARDNGIRSVIKNAPLEERWRKGTALNDKYHYFALVAGNHQEIARSCYYEDEAAMLIPFAWIQGGESAIGAGSQEIDGVLWSAAALQAQAEEEASKPDKVVDDYMPCNDYAGEPGFYKFYNEDREEYYFGYNDYNGKVILRSEGYTTEKARDNGINSVIKNAPLEERWKEGTALNGKYHYYYLVAGNHQEIARSCYYDDKAAMLIPFGWVRGEDSPIGAGSALVGGALLSASAIRAQKEEEEAAAAVALAARKEREEAAVAALAAREKAKEEAAAAAAAAAVAASAATGSREEAVEASGSAPWLSGIWPWLLALLLLALLLWLFRGCFGCGPDQEATADAEATPTPMEEVTPAIDTIAVDTVEVELEPLGPDAAALGFVPGSIEAQLADFLSDPNATLPGEFTWHGANYPFNSAKMDRAAYPTVDNIAKLLKAYPNARINIKGFIDGTESDIYNGPFGDGKITLSGIRARCLYKKLIKRGIDKDVMTFEGLAAANPIASNDTREGRRQNRRTEIVVTNR